MVATKAARAPGWAQKHLDDHKSKVSLVLCSNRGCDICVFVKSLEGCQKQGERGGEQPADWPGRGRGRMSGTLNLEVESSMIDPMGVSSLQFLCSQSFNWAHQVLGIDKDTTSVTQNKGWKPVLGGKVKEGGQPGTRCQIVSALCRHHLSAGNSARHQCNGVWPAQSQDPVMDQPWLLSTPVCLEGEAFLVVLMVLINKKDP